MLWSIVGLLVGGFLITGFALSQLGGDGGVMVGANLLFDQQRDRFNSVGSEKSSVPFGTIFSGIFLLNLFYWTTNQQIIQRTFGASSLAEGQKGVLLTGAFKLLGPLYLVIPGMIAFSMFAGEELKAVLEGRELPPLFSDDKDSGESPQEIEDQAGEKKFDLPKPAIGGIHTGEMTTN